MKPRSHDGKLFVNTNNVLLVGNKVGCNGLGVINDKKGPKKYNHKLF